MEDTDSNAQGDNGDLISIQEQPEDRRGAPGFSDPGCGDKYGKLNATLDNPGQMTTSFSSSVTISLSPPPPPYVLGTFFFHLTETPDYNSNDRYNYYSNMIIKNNNYIIISKMANDKNYSFGYIINNGKSYLITSKLLLLSMSKRMIKFNLSNNQNVVY